MPHINQQGINASVTIGPTVSCKSLVKIGLVVSRENILIDVVPLEAELSQERCRMNQSWTWVIFVTQPDPTQ